MDQLVGGMDGCSVGWVIVTTPASGESGSQVKVVADLSRVIADLDKGRLVAVAIDIPIGLPEGSPRRCDLEARKMLGPRKSSVFPAPFRGVLGSETYEEAGSRSRAISGKGMSKQAFAILPRIAEVDRLMTPELQQSLVEVHPEVCFTVLAGHPMDHHKSKPEGRAERLEALRTVFSDLDDHVNDRITGVRPDDVLDAFVAAWTARRWLARTHTQLGGDLDERGLRMEMIA